MPFVPLVALYLLELVIRALGPLTNRTDGRTDHFGVQLVCSGRSEPVGRFAFAVIKSFSLATQPADIGLLHPQRTVIRYMISASRSTFTTQSSTATFNADTPTQNYKESLPLIE